MAPISDADVVLPKGWPEHARSAFLCAVAMARITLAEVLSGFENGRNPKAQILAELEAERARSALMAEELRIKNSRFGRIPAHKRPRYLPTERLAILAARAAAGWSLVETARRFDVTPKTIASWMRRIDDHDEPELLKTPMPVNKYPDYVRFVIQRLSVLEPTLGSRRIAQLLARAGLHVAPSTVRRILREEPPRRLDGDDSTSSETTDAPEEVHRDEPEEGEATERVVTARYPHHVWHVDASVVPTLFGFWVPWLPNSVLIFWPFAYWVVGVIDHHSRACVATGIFRANPTAEQVVAVLERGVAAAGSAPKHIISDQGSQFQGLYLAWCKRRNVLPRFGAIGQHGSIAILERFWRSMKSELFRRIFVPFRLARAETELALYVRWYNGHRPHQGLGGLTPNERLADEVPAHELPRMETRPGIPIARGDPAPISRRVEHLRLVVTPLEGRKHLPIVELREAA